jgi:hypothetical protein
MSELSFAAYTVCCFVAFAGQLAFALREWRALGRRDAMFVDQVYVRVERYFGLAFRDKLQQWLRRPAREVASNVFVVAKEGEEIWVHHDLVVPPGGRFEAIVVADTLETGYGCALLREVYTRHDCRLGAANVVQAMASDGVARIGRGTRVIRWIDAAGELVLEPHCRVLGRATSATRIVLHAGARVASAHAPEIVTVDDGVEAPASHTTDPNISRTTLGDDDAAWQAIGASGRRRPMCPGCIASDGDLILPTVRITANLVVRGDLMVGPHSVIEGDVKATGSIRIGAQSACRGSIVAAGDVQLAAGVSFTGVIFAEGSIGMAAGVTGIRRDPGVAVYAAEAVRLQAGVTIHGKVSSGDQVVVVGG